MTEEDARSWIRARADVSRETKLAAFAAMVIAENDRQNLISPATTACIWSRHVVDSAQLIDLAAPGAGTWLDIGSGAGFPGMVIAALTERNVILCEPRRRRAEFLSAAAEALGLADRITILQQKVESVALEAAVISARAVARLDRLFAAAEHCSRHGTVWLLPKGKRAREEVAAARRSWHGAFHVEQSITDQDSLIVVAKGVRRR